MDNSSPHGSTHKVIGQLAEFFIHKLCEKDFVTAVLILFTSSKKIRCMLHKTFLYLKLPVAAQAAPDWVCRKCNTSPFRIKRLPEIGYSGKRWSTACIA